MNNSEKRFKFGLEILYNCPRSFVASNNQISSILAGNFSQKQKETSARTAIFVEQLVQNLPDSIITLSEDGIIKTVDKATERTIGIESLEISTLVGQYIYILSNFVVNTSPFPPPRLIVHQSVCLEKDLTFKKNHLRFI
jgi:hypothetical protein